MSYSDYYPFGMLMPNRNGSDVSPSEDYEYGMGGMEKDNEISGNGNSYTTEFRQYDPRIARWTSTDPLFKEFSWQSPYVAFDNNPIYYNDPQGLAATEPVTTATVTDDNNSDKVSATTTEYSGGESKKLDKNSEKYKSYVKSINENANLNHPHAETQISNVREVTSTTTVTKTDYTISYDGSGMATGIVGTTTSITTTTTKIVGEVTMSYHGGSFVQNRGTIDGKSKSSASPALRSNISSANTVPQELQSLTGSLTSHRANNGGQSLNQISGFEGAIERQKSTIAFVSGTTNATGAATAGYVAVKFVQTGVAGNPITGGIITVGGFLTSLSLERGLEILEEKHNRNSTERGEGQSKQYKF